MVPEQRRDNANAARKASAAHVQVAHQQYLKALGGVPQQDKQMADSRVVAAQARLRRAQAMLAETKIVAPITGEVDERFANPGEVVFPGVPVFTMVNLDNLWVTVNIREDQFQGVAMERIIKGRIPALGLESVAFRIEYISPQGEFATWRSTRQSSGYDVKSFEIHAVPVAAIDGLRPGMSVLFDWPQQ